MIKKLLLIFITAAILIFPGCWNRREVDQLAIVVAAGYDLLPDNEVVLTAQIAKPGNITGRSGGGGGGQGSAIVIASERGRTAYEAVARLNAKIPRSYYFGNNRILVISEKIAKSDRFRDVLDLATSQRLVRRTREIYITSDSARDIIEMMPYLEKLSAEDIFKMYTTQPEIGSFPLVSLNNFMNMLNAKDIEPIANRIGLNTVIDHKAKEVEGQDNKLPDEQRTTAPGKKLPWVKGTAVFRRLQMVGWLDEYETRDMLIIQGKLPRSSIVVPYQGNRGISYTIYGEKREIKPRINDDRISFDVNVKLKATLEERDTPVDISKPETVKKLSNDLNKTIKEDLVKTINKVQKEYRSDIFGFGQKFHRTFRKEWQQVKDNWDDAFADAEINVRVESDITGSELMENTFKTE